MLEEADRLSVCRYLEPKGLDIFQVSAASLASVGHCRAWMHMVTWCHMAMAGVMCLTTVGPTVLVWFYTQADESLGSPSSQDPMMTVDGLMHSIS